MESQVGRGGTHLLVGVGLSDGYALLPCDGGDGFQRLCRILNDQVHGPVEGLLQGRSKIAGYGGPPCGICALKLQVEVHIAAPRLLIKAGAEDPQAPYGVGRQVAVANRADRGLLGGR